MSIKTNFKKTCDPNVTFVAYDFLSYPKNHCQAQYHEAFPLYLTFGVLQFQVLCLAKHFFFFFF